MAERKSGPVKPPVIDLTARPAGESKPSDTPQAAIAPPVPPTGDGKTTPPKPTGKPEGKASAAETREPAAAAAAPVPSAPLAARRSPWGPAIAGGIGGAVIAVAVCYGLAYTGYWPAATATEVRIDQLQDQLAQAEKTGAANATALSDVGTRLGGLQNDVAAKLGGASNSLTTVQQRVDKLEAAKPPAVDLSPLEAQVKTLSSRVDAVAAGASSADAGALAANLATVQQSVAALGTKLDALDAHSGNTDTAIASLKGELDSAKSAIDQAAKAPSPKTIASAMQLPLLISALESDFAAGRPYATDLANLTAAVPEAHIPAAVSDAATTGLPAPDDFARRFEAAMPDMLGAQPPGTDSSWQGQVADWVRGVLALRPQGELTGDSPDAVLSRLDGAVTRHDFAGAAKLFAQLPPAMQQAAGDVAVKLRALADADTFIAGLRTTALAPADGAQK